MDWNTILELLKKYYPLLILAGVFIILFIHSRVKKKKEAKTQALERPLQPHIPEPPQYYEPIQKPEPVFDYTEEVPQQEFSLEDNADNVLEYIEKFTEKLTKDLERTSKNMEREVSSIDKVDSKVNKIMDSLGKHRTNLNKQKNVLRMNISAIENAKNALTTPQINPRCSLCNNDLTTVSGGYNCPIHGFIRWG